MHGSHSATGAAVTGQRSRWKRTTLYLSALFAGLLALSLTTTPASAATRALHAKRTFTVPAAIAKKTFTNPIKRSPSRLSPAVTTAASPPAGSYVPCDITNAYHLGTSQTGVGKTIAIVDAEDQSTISADLASFNSATGLPSSGFSVFKVGTVPTAAVGSTAALETTLDVEWAHAAAPGALIELVEVPSLSFSDLFNGVVFATDNLNADVVSMSWSLPEGPAFVGNQTFTPPDLETLISAQFFPPTNGAGRPITYVASAGDSGFGPGWPAVASGVVGVGGTSLTPAAFGYAAAPPSHTDCSGVTGTPGVTSTNETVWGDESNGKGGLQGAGGGPSVYESKPGAQGIAPGGNRVSPDVSMLADPNTGVAIFYNGSWFNNAIGGTSLSAPMWAGVVARIDQARADTGRANLNALRNVFWPYSASAADFNDIISGSAPPAPGDVCVSTGACVAQTGFDQVTGRGSPLAQNLIPDLATVDNLDIESLGGAASSAPAVASWFPGRQDVFVRGPGNNLFHKWISGGGWSDYENLGGTLTSDPAAVSWGMGRVDVFVRGPDNALWHKWWDGGWSGWQSLGGQLTGAPAVSSWASGRLDVFVPGPGSAMFHKSWNGSSWSDWENLGGLLTSGPGAVSWDVNRVDVFARGGDGQMWHRAWNGSAWEAWEPLGGALSNGVAPAPASIQPGQLDVYVFGQNPSNTLWHRVWAGAWGPWTQVRPESWRLGVATVSEINTGSVDIHVVGSDNALHHTNF